MDWLMLWDLVSKEDQSHAHWSQTMVHSAKGRKDFLKKQASGTHAMTRSQMNCIFFSMSASREGPHIQLEQGRRIAHRPLEDPEIVLVVRKSM